MSLRKKIIITVIVSFVIIIGIFIISVIFYYKSDFEKIRIKTGEAILKSNISEIVYSAMIENKKILETIAKSLKNTGIVDYLIVKKNNNLIFSNKKTTLESPIVIVKSITKRPMGVPVNIVIEMGVNTNDFKKYLKKAILLLFISFVIITIIFGFLISFFLSKLFKPLNSINAALTKLSSGSYEKIKIPKYKELKTIVNTYNMLVDSLDKKDRKIQQQIREIEEKNNLLKQQLAEIQALQEILITKEKLAALGTVVAGVAHEINNPLAAIVGLCELHLVKLEDEKIKELLKKIINYCDRINSIIKNLKVYGKSNIKGKRLCSLNEIINDAIEMENNKKLLNKVTIKGNYKRYKGKILCKKDELVQVFINLLNNSIEAMKGEGEIIIDIFEKENYIYVDFKDSGPGIPKELLNKIFDPFFTTKEIEGTGLGLFIVFKILESHNAEIQALPSEKGAFFRLKFIKQNE